MFFTKAFKGNNAWYMYLVVLLLVFITTQLGGIPFILYKVLSNPETMQQAMSGAEPDTAALTAVTGNAELALMLLAFAAGLGSLFLFARVFQKKSAADITTGRPRFDWKRFAFGTAVWGALLLIISGASILTDDDIVFRFDATQFFSLALVGLLLFPFQTGFEEVMFRGYLMQASGLVFRYRWAALLITSLAFGLMHGANPEIDTFGFWTAMPQYIIIGLIMGYIAIKDDGLELAFGMHFVNNLLSTLVVSADGTVFQTASLFRDLSPTSSVADTVIMAAAGVVFVYLCNTKYRFLGRVNLWGRIEKPQVCAVNETEFKE